jgi:hypothetical protein
MRLSLEQLNFVCQFDWNPVLNLRAFSYNAKAYGSTDLAVLEPKKSRTEKMAPFMKGS